MVECVDFTIENVAKLMGKIHPTVITVNRLSRTIDIIIVFLNERCIATHSHSYTSVDNSLLLAVMPLP